MQSGLFDDTPRATPEAIGEAVVTYAHAASILTKGSGFMEEYDYTLNPYSGCTFGCNYCYAAFFARTAERVNNWGLWVQIKENAVALLRKQRSSSKLRGRTIYCSSVTDPYQPIEKQLEITRALLTELAAFHQPRLVIQTRSPLVTRDIDVLLRFQEVQVNMTVTTDSDDVRRAFEPKCPNNRVRLRAIGEVRSAGIQTCITMTPLLPVEDADAFAEMLLGTGVERFIVQPFHPNRGRFVAGTRDAAMEAVRRFDWTPRRYAEVVRVLEARLPNLGFGKEGFAPPA